jgi:hypothetical protein
VKTARPDIHGLPVTLDDLVLDGTQPIEDGVAALESLLGDRGLL